MFCSVENLQRGRGCGDDERNSRPWSSSPKLTPPLPAPRDGAPGTLLDRLEGSRSTRSSPSVRHPVREDHTLATWAARDPRPSRGWSSTGATTTPAVLLNLHRGCARPPRSRRHKVFRALSSPGASIMGDVVPRLGAALSARTRPGGGPRRPPPAPHQVRRCRRRAVDHLPARSQVVFPAEAELSLPVGRLRGRRPHRRDRPGRAGDGVIRRPAAAPGRGTWSWPRPSSPS